MPRHAPGHHLQLRPSAPRCPPRPRPPGDASSSRARSAAIAERRRPGSAHRRIPPAQVPPADGRSRQSRRWPPGPAPGGPGRLGGWERLLSDVARSGRKASGRASASLRRISTASSMAARAGSRRSRSARRTERSAGHGICWLGSARELDAPSETWAAHETQRAYECQQAMTAYEQLRSAPVTPQQHHRPRNRDQLGGSGRSAPRGCGEAP